MKPRLRTNSKANESSLKASFISHLYIEILGCERRPGLIPNMATPVARQ
jgi:hypothetical protein